MIRGRLGLLSRALGQAFASRVLRGHAVRMVPLRARALAAAKRTARSIEDTYQKKTQREHILLRPEPYVGSMQPETRYSVPYALNCLRSDFLADRCGLSTKTGRESWERCKENSCILLLSHATPLACTVCNTSLLCSTFSTKFS